MIPKGALRLLRFKKGTLYTTSHRSDGTVRQRKLKIYVQDIVEADSSHRAYKIGEKIEKDRYTLILKTVLENHTTQTFNVDIPQSGIIRLIFGTIWDVCETKEINASNVEMYKRIVLNKA